ncbi:MAG: Xaa-Pro aminopeptidase [actinobacterium acIB-AMD-7]|nr:MAG: Xaa-Pro aminopeptidase [actinobacterium acIB-AMD-7]
MNSASNANSGGKDTEVRTHDIPIADAMVEFMKVGWAPSPLDGVTAHPSIPYTKIRREKVSKQFVGKRLIFPSGSLKVRSNDSDYQFRAHSAFSWFTGIVASDCVPDSLFIMEPTADGHQGLLFIHPRSPRDNNEFYKNTRYGEFWVGRRMTLDETETKYALQVKQIESIEEFLSDKKETLLVRGQDPAIDKLVVEDAESEKEFLNYISVMRAVKDKYEIDEMQKAIDASVRGFADMVRIFPAATAVPRGERVVEAAFYGRARLEGNDNGYPSIVASGAHACILHWIKNDGDVLPGDLILIDAGVEVESHYTADITRTFPVNGKFTQAQRNIYMIVYKAQQAGIAAIKPGARFRDIHNACMVEIARGAQELGVLPISAEESLLAENGLHRRWQFHGSGHHLGIDVHDCAHARKEQYSDALLEPGMILTVEPGFYVQPDDTLFPEEYRGIGVRIEDDILVTESGAKILSNALPRHPDEVEAYMAKLLK